MKDSTVEALQKFIHAVRKFASRDCTIGSSDEAHELSQMAEVLQDRLENERTETNEQ